MKSWNAGMFLACLIIAALATAGATMEPKTGRETEISMTTEEKVVQGFAAALIDNVLAREGMTQADRAKIRLPRAQTQIRAAMDNRCPGRFSDYPFKPDVTLYRILVEYGFR
jgi:hypothetical protein